MSEPTTEAGRSLLVLALEAEAAERAVAADRAKLAERIESRIAAEMMDDDGDDAVIEALEEVVAALKGRQ